MQGTLIKVGAKVVTHSRYVIFQMAEVAVPRELFAAILDRVQRSVCRRRWCSVSDHRDRVKR